MTDKKSKTAARKPAAKKAPVKKRAPNKADAAKPKALTPKQEKFAQAIVSGESLSDAYRSAYKCDKMSDNAINVQASKLSKDPKITLRVDELRKPVTEAAQITLQGLTDDLRRAAGYADTKKDARALTGAIMAIAELHGLKVNKNANTDGKGNDLPQETPLTVDEALDLLNKIRE